jgi:flagellar motor switch/type III secretory pathway protein FliN
MSVNSSELQAQAQENTKAKVELAAAIIAYFLKSRQNEGDVGKDIKVERDEPTEVETPLLTIERTQEEIEKPIEPPQAQIKNINDVEEPTEEPTEVETPPLTIEKTEEEIEETIEPPQTQAKNINDVEETTEKPTEVETPKSKIKENKTPTNHTKTKTLFDPRNDIDVLSDRDKIAIADLLVAKPGDVLKNPDAKGLTIKVDGKVIAKVGLDGRVKSNGFYQSAIEVTNELQSKQERKTASDLIGNSGNNTVKPVEVADKSAKQTGLDLVNNVLSGISPDVADALDSSATTPISPAGKSQDNTDLETPDSDRHLQNVLIAKIVDLGDMAIDADSNGFEIDDFKVSGINSYQYAIEYRGEKVVVNKDGSIDKNLQNNANTMFDNISVSTIQGALDKMERINPSSNSRIDRSQQKVMLSNEEKELAKKYTSKINSLNRLKQQVSEFRTKVNNKSIKNVRVGDTTYPLTNFNYSEDKQGNWEIKDGSSQLIARGDSQKVYLNPQLNEFSREEATKQLAKYESNVLTRQVRKFIPGQKNNSNTAFSSTTGKAIGSTDKKQKTKGGAER